MKVYKTLFIDFDGIYENKIPNQNTIVLTNLYNNNNVENINQNTNSNDYSYSQFEKYLNGIDKSEINLESKNFYLYSFFFYPLSQWFLKINNLINQNKIDENTEIVFSSFSNNKKAFIFEAEGENSGQMLYKKAYFLSYYIKKHFQNKNLNKIKIIKNYTLSSRISYFLRGFIILHLKLSQILFFKFFTFKRNYISSKSERKVTTILTRGLIQTQFIKPLYDSKPEEFIAIVNESTSNPFRNLKAAKKSFTDFFYAEGFIYLNDLIKEYLIVLKGYTKFSTSNNCSDFFNISINLIDLVPEILIKEFHLKTYSHSINRSIIHLNNKERYETKKIISFESLPPFVFFLKKMIKKEIIQIQTTEIFARKQPKFSYADIYFFNNKKTFEQHNTINSHFSENFKLLNNIKYFDTVKKREMSSFKHIVYFCQPLYYDDELSYIDFLFEFCNSYNYEFKIKLHPRSNISMYHNYKKSIIQNTINSVEVLKSCDIAITRNSSIGLDSWYLNTPIIFLVNKTLNNEGISYIPKNYLGTIKDDLTTDKFNELLPEIINDFYNNNFHSSLIIDKQKIIFDLIGN